LASHRGWWTSQMKVALSSFLISSWMKFYRSTDCFRGFCWTGLALGYIFRWCSITSLGILGIYDGCQANTLTLAQKKATSVSCVDLDGLHGDALIVRGLHVGC
jgi:hypothetical protein